MTNVTLSIPESLHRRMKQHSEIRWSEVVRKSIAEKLDDLEMMDKLTRRIKMTQRDVDELSTKIKQEVFEELA